MNMSLMPAYLVVVLWLAVAAYQDLRWRRVGNLLTLGGGALAALWLLVEHRAWTGASVPGALLAALLGLVLTLPGYLLGKLGAADVKLLPSLGLAIGPQALMNSFAAACLFTVLLMLGSRSLLRNARFPRVLEKAIGSLSVSSAKSFPFIFSIFIGYLANLLFISKFLH